MLDRFELQKLRDLPIEGVAGRLGIEVVKHKALCPFHDDHHASLSFSTRRNTYRCFACGAHGGTIDLVMNYLDKDFKEACQWLSPLPASPKGEEIGAIGKQMETKPSPLGGSWKGAFDAARYARFFEHPWLSPEAQHFLFDERKLDPRVVRWCRLTSWRDKQGISWLQTPYYNREGNLVGIQNRNLSPLPSSPKGEETRPDGNPSPLGEVGRGLPRFRFPAGSQCGIYNLPVLNLLKPGDELYITEGCSDCWAMLSAGHKAIAIPSATLLTQKDIELLNGLSSSPLGEDGRGLSFHMYPDRDLPGERLFLQLQRVLPSLVHHQLPPDCKDFSDLYLKRKNDNSLPS